MKKRRDSTKSKQSTRGGRLSRARRAHAKSARRREARTPAAPAVLPGEEGELPNPHAETKVVLLPVNPYLAHVYWGIAPGDQEAIAKAFVRLDRQTQPVLRFYDVTETNLEGIHAHSWFDVEIDLRAGNWYVHLQRPARSYCIDLGLRIKGERFHRLARSNIAETPRAWPSEKMQERFLPAEPNDVRGEMMVPRVIKPATATNILPELSEAGARQPKDEKGPEPKELRIFRAVAPGEMERRVAEVFKQRMQEWSGGAPEGRPSGKPQHSRVGQADLTQLGETSFSAGASAGRMTSIEGGTAKCEG